MTIKVKILLLVIILLSSFLRIYKLDRIPPSLNWDEVAAAYNAYTIANWVRDEWGEFLPLTFTSFRDDKHPIHIYFSVPIIKIFGPSDLTARISTSIIGIVTILVIFYLSRVLFKDNLVALFSALFLAVSPYHLQLTRGVLEMNYPVFFFMLGLLMFFLALQKKREFLYVSSFSFGLSLLSYHSSKIVLPPILLLLFLSYFRELKKLSYVFYISIFIFMMFVLLLFVEPRLLGLARAQQTSFGQNEIEKTLTYQKTKNSFLGLAEITLKQYSTHFTKEYLFISGDQNPRNSVKVYGEFYKIDALFIFVGTLYLLSLKSRITLIIFAWLLLSPLPSSLVNGAPNATRALFMMGSMHLIAGLGASKIISWFSGRFKIFILGLILLLLAFQASSFFNYYFNTYPKKDTHEWQYGMKEVVEFVRDHEEYDQVFVTDIRSQPYIFFLYYLKYPLPDYLNSVVYNTNEGSNKYNTVSYFGGYYLKGKDTRNLNLYFGGWDPIESIPEKGRLYVISSSQYDGLRHKSSFDVKKIIYYPDGAASFYLISAL